MVVANPLSERDDLLGDDNDPEQLRSSTQEAELGSNPSADEGTRPAESTSNFTKNPTLVVRMRGRGLDQLSPPPTSPVLIRWM
jgi:hypothetical protein